MDDLNDLIPEALQAANLWSQLAPNPQAPNDWPLTLAKIITNAMLERDKRMNAEQDRKG